MTPFCFTTGFTCLISVAGIRVGNATQEERVLRASTLRVTRGTVSSFSEDHLACLC